MLVRWFRSLWKQEAFSYNIVGTEISSLRFRYNLFDDLRIQLTEIIEKRHVWRSGCVKENFRFSLIPSPLRSCLKGTGLQQVEKQVTSGCRVSRGCARHVFLTSYIHGLIYFWNLFVKEKHLKTNRVHCRFLQMSRWMSWEQWSLFSLSCSKRW